MVIEQQEVQRALQDGEFIPHFQPIVHLHNGELHGFEMLARWNHPQRGLIAPDDFIEQAEREGWIGDLTRQLMLQAFPALLQLPTNCSLSVNISPQRLHAPSLPSQIESLAARGGFPLSRLIIEVTESALMDNIPQARRVASELKELGCQLALDDFGTGYSSLSHLQALPFDELKVDRTFVHEMTQKRNSRKIVAAVIGLGQSLGLTTVAEGVETPDQVEMLLWLGCELGQGWHFGRPVPATGLPAVVTALRYAIPIPATAESTARPASGLDSLPSQRLAHLQAVYDSAPVGLAFVDCDLRYRDLNRRQANINGCSIEEHLGRTIEEMVPDVFPKVAPYLSRALKGESISGIEVLKAASGSNPDRNILVSYEPARDEADEVIGVSIALMDITALKHAEAARKESEEHLRHMMELLPQIPWVLDPEGRALDVSQRWLELSGMQGDEWRGFGWLNALHPDDVQPTLDHINRALETGQSIDICYRLRSRNTADCIWIHARGSARLGPDNKIQSWYGSLEPIPNPA